MQRILRLLTCLASLAIGSHLVHAAALPANPNIIVILADDLGYGDLGCYGATRLKTPNLDRLASQGLRFTQAYAPSSTCTPTRYSIMTGEYAWRQKARKTSILDGDAPLAIEPGRLTLPAMLRNAGYQTGVVGKWHLGLGDGQTPVDFNGEIKPGPLEVGFDYCHVIPATVDRVPCVWIENRRVVNRDRADPIRVSYVTNLSDEPTGLEHPELLKQPADKQHACTIINGISRIGYMRGGKAARFKDEELPDTVVAKSAAFIEAHKAEPFFLYVGLFEPHVPRVAQARFAGTSECGLRGDVIQQADWQVGQIMDALDRLKLADNTLVIFTSDNGPVFFDGYMDRSLEDAHGHQPTDGLRGWKYLVFEGGTRVPFIARWPGRVPAGVSDQMLCLTDLLATFAVLTGQALPTGTGADSMNLLPVLFGVAEKPARDAVVQQGISGALALRQGDWKYIPATGSAGAAGMGSGADPNDRRFADSRIPEPLLFDLKTDPGETSNLAGQMPERVAAMKQRLDSCVAGPATRAEQPGSAPRCVVTVDASDRRGPISPMLMGFNFVYKYEQDSIWADGKLERALKELKCGLLRWPGGTVVSTYHWKQMPGTPIMDLEEYMGHVRAIGAQPLVGVNVHETFVSGREQEGLDEARSLIEHCVKSNYQVKYWYIDNELYLPKSQPRMTAEQYARAISRYAAVLRAVDPKIEIAANWDPRWSPGWETILQQTGKAVDIADFHLYYHGRKELSWDSWLQDTPMSMFHPSSAQGGGVGRSTFAEMLQDFRAQAKSRGHELKLAALEWNLFKDVTGPMSPFQSALVEAEEFGQFINAGMEMACFWPLHINGNKYRVLYDQRSGELNPNFEMFKMYSDVLGQTVLGSQADQPEVRTVAARSLDGKTVTVYLLRKTGEAAPLPVTINLNHFKPAKARAKVFDAASLNAGTATVSDLAIKSQAPLRVDLPAHSFTEIILNE